MGCTYDRRNILDLFRYLLPVRLIPSRLREDALHFGSGKDTETICSSMLAEAFSQVDFSILPQHIRKRAVLRSPLQERPLGRPRATPGPILKPATRVSASRADFDLSPYFDVIKFTAREPLYSATSGGVIN